MEKTIIDSLLLKRGSCQNKWLSKQEGEIQPVATITQHMPSLGITFKGRPRQMETLFCIYLFFQPLLGRGCVFPSQQGAAGVIFSWTS